VPGEGLPGGCGGQQSSATSSAFSDPRSSPMPRDRCDIPRLTASLREAIKPHSRRAWTRRA